MTIVIIIIGGTVLLITVLIYIAIFMSNVEAFVSNVKKEYNKSDKKDKKYVEYNEYLEDEDDESLEEKKHSLANEQFAPDIDSFHIGDIGKLTYL